ncbi:AAA family ATPase (plasmid) [Pseudonocardia sp. DSM 110487]|uniref:AAA family ATPase n=1 Tax=Pseudonocardia sp. DSM 110487 TaxID=2865833 RepID=UPI001C6A7C87|nr:AAA family ATPase [Pseudonocardia sp. DSM 110487]QYN41023.1 AAA family ATPase [Pseudonocardia sp. DSM 110487]
MSEAERLIGELGALVDATATGHTAPGATPRRARATTTTPSRPRRHRPRITPVGPQTRPNGEIYQPRTIGVHEDLALIRTARQHHESVLLYGPPGTGKTAVLEAAFVMDASAGTPGFESIVVGDDTNVSDFVGSLHVNTKTGEEEWVPGPLHRAVVNDVPLFVDEIALADPNVLSILYPLMDGRRVLNITGYAKLPPIPVGDGFSILGAYNPGVPGAVLSPALRDRFDHVIEVPSDWTLAREMGVNDDLVTVAENLDRKRRDGSVVEGIQLRTLLKVQQQIERYGQEYALSGLLAKVNDLDRAEVAAALRARFPRVEPLRMGGRYGR